MNNVQHIPESRYGPVLVTLNPPFEPDAAKIVGRWTYCHPVLDETVSISMLDSSHNLRMLWFLRLFAHNEKCTKSKIHDPSPTQAPG